jgi:hypothetical protein
MESRFNIVIEKNEIGYSASCPEMGKYKGFLFQAEIKLHHLR